MKKLRISGTSLIFLALQDEIRLSRDSRYDHRLHAVLLVAQGMSCPEVGRLLGDAPRTVEYWAHRLKEEGLSGLVDLDRLGKPSRIGDKQYREIGEVLRQSPLDVGMGTNIWDGKTLSAFIQSRSGIEVGVKQYQRLFRQLGSRMRKPRPVIASADPERQEEHKKAPNHDPGRRPRTKGATCGRWMKFISSNTVRGVGCGFHSSSKTLCFGISPAAKALGTLGP